MASSKDAEFIAVPQLVLDLQKTHKVFCRLQDDRYDNPFDNFLSKVAETTNYPSTGGVTGKKVKAVMLFHNYFDVVGTVVIEIYHVYLDFAGHRIDFKKSNWMEIFHGCPNFWAGFGMVIAPVRDNCPEFGGEDLDGSNFVKLVQEFGEIVDSANCPICSDVRNSCAEKPFIPANGSVGQPTFACPNCGQCWWQYNEHFHLWKNVSSDEFTVITLNQELSPFFDMQ